MTCVLSSRGGAVVAGGATARRDRSVTEGSRRPRRSAMALIAACRGRKMTSVFSSRGGAVLPGIDTAAGYSLVVEGCCCPGRGAWSTLPARLGVEGAPCGIDMCHNVEITGWLQQ